jgi:hypothetical protein
MSDFEPLTPSKVAALANAVQTLYQQPINDNISLTGTTAATTKTYLNFGYNVITTASATNYACRLPNPPIKGRSTVIVNNSGFPIVIYPSVTGGSINGVVNGSATVPSDGKPYTFFCYENPLPGGWTWTPPAIGQYDSGVITVNSTGGNNVIAALNASSWSESQGFTTSNSWGYGSLVEPPINGSIYRPNPYWNSVKKVKVYTNLLNDSGGFVFALAVNGQITYYQVGTTNVVTNGFTLMGDYGGYGYLTSTDWNTFNGKQAAFGSQTANYFYAAPNGSAGSPTFRAVVAADIPTLNQNTSGNAGTVTNGVYTTGSYADPTWITSLAGSKITGTISGGTF